MLLSCHSSHVHIHNLRNLHNHILHIHILLRGNLVQHQPQLQLQLPSCHSIHVHSHNHHNLHNHILHILVQHQLQQISFHNIHIHHIHHILHTLRNHIHHNHHGGSQPLLKHRQLQGAQLQSQYSSCGSCCTIPTIS